MGFIHFVFLRLDQELDQELFVGSFFMIYKTNIDAKVNKYRYVVFKESRRNF